MSEKSFLEEGYDFIEESYCEAPLDFKDTEELSISESTSDNSSKYKILGVVKGCMAPIGELSRNGRLYENTHWQKVLANPNLQERIANRKFFGMISHENKPIDDTNFKAGEISHICSVLEVREDENKKPYLYGELEILDTPAGRILKAMYEGGAGLYVSTRGAGKLLEVAGKPYKMVDPSTYYVNSIDFVMNPGFIKAKPTFEAVSKEDNSAPSIQESSIKEEVKEESVSDLKKQIEKLTKIVEKVVDDVYEEPSQEVKVDESKEVIPEGIDEFLSLMSETNVSDETMKEILDMISSNGENK